ncbi:hypothetical protein MMC13_002718 [Lambiella insularis]|nr:hypothetical protein [Lambiella insularis]
MGALPPPPPPPSLEETHMRDNAPTPHPTIAPPRARSPASAARIQTKNRRKRYLDLHPHYFSPALELADPLSYDRLVRRFQTPREREEEGRRKGYAGVLEADLWRAEAKIDALARPSAAGAMRDRRGRDGEILAEETDEVPTTKEEGLRRWRKEMELRFVSGGDDDFEYDEVDRGVEYDDKGVEEREDEERWFEEEEPQWVTDKAGEHTNAVVVEGETGVQDF